MVNRTRNVSWPGLFLASLSVLFLSACASVGPDFEKPEVDVAPEWLQAENEKISTDPAAYRDWWKNFNDPVLDQLIDRAYQNNLTLQIAGLRVYEARAILGVATGAKYPQIQQMTASAGGTRLSTNAEPISNLPDPIRDGVDNTFGNYRVGFDAAWEMDFWGKFRRIDESAGANYLANIATYDDVLVTITAEVANSYILLRSLEERLAIAEHNVALQQRSLDIASVRSRNQLTTELDPALARSLLRTTEALVPLLRAGIRDTKNALSVLLGESPGEIDDLLAQSSGIPMPPLEASVGMPVDLLRRRPDIRRAEYSAASQSARIGVAKADLYPALSLVGNVGMASGDLGDLFESDSFRAFGFLSFRWNIFNYGRIKNLVRAEDARFQQTIVNYHNTVLRSVMEVEGATNRFIEAQAETVTLADGVQASQRAVELAEIQYREGTAAYNRVLDSQRFLLLTQDRHAAARGRIGTNFVAMYKALGGGWDNQTNQKDFVPPEMIETMQQRVNWGDMLNSSASQE
jgi:NodT family efflux transporter outer membrane factor (OMF) lipoprotein